MDISITVKPILVLVKYPTSTVVKTTPSLLCLTPRLALDNKVTLMCSKQVLTDLLEKYCFINLKKMDLNPEFFFLQVSVLPIMSACP